MNTQQVREFVDAYGWVVVTALWFGSYYQSSNALYLVAAFFSMVAAGVNLQEHWGEQ